MTAKETILVTPRSLTGAGLDSVAELEPLRQAGFEIIGSSAGQTPGEAELIDLLRGRVVGWLAGVETISGKVLASAGALRVIARNGVGADNVDLGAAESSGIQVRTAPGANAQGVAELAVAHGLALLRSIPQGNDALHSGRWERTKGRELGDVRVGVVGYGSIGRRVANLFTALGTTVTVYDPFLAGAPEHQVVRDIDDLLSNSDVLSLHAPPDPNGPLLSRSRLALLPSGAIVINTARSALIDPVAMHEALESGAIAGYAVDAFDQEPPIIDELLSHPRTVMSAHVGGFTDASVRRATEAAVANLVEVLRGA